MGKLLENEQEVVIGPAALKTGFEEIGEAFAMVAKTAMDAAMEKTVKAQKSQALEEAKTFEKMADTFDATAEMFKVLAEGE